MNKNTTALLILVSLISVLSFTLFAGCGDPGNTATPDSATPDSATSAANTVDITEAGTEQTVALEDTTAPTEPTSITDDDSEGEELVFSEVFPDFPVNFVSHGGKPGEEGPDEHYMHASLKISDGSIEGDFYSNLESTDSETIEQLSSWSGTVRDDRVYKTDEYSYYIYVDDVVYENEPLTSETLGGKTVSYVYGFGLDPDNGNKLYIFTPETPIDSLISDDVLMDLRQFLTMMMKDGEAEALDCYMIRGKVDNCYVSITEEQAAMAPPDRPGPPGEEE